MNLQLGFEWSFELYTLVLVMTVVGPAALYLLWEGISSIKISDLIIEGVHDLDFDGLDKKLGKTIDKVGDTIDDFTESVKEKVRLINEIAESLGMSTDIEDWKRIDIVKRVEIIIKKIKHDVNISEEKFKKTINKYDHIMQSVFDNMDEVAKDLGIRTNLQTWKDKSILVKLKFMAFKARKLRREAGYND